MEETEEIWKGVVGYEGKYMVSNKGRVKSLDTVVVYPYNRGGVRVFKGRIVKLLLSDRGYHRLNLSRASKKKSHYVHRLVAIAFIPNPDNKPEVNHIDFNPLNNCVENLNWMTAKENIRHSYDKIAASARLHMKKYHGDNSPMCKPVIKMDINGKFIREYKSIREATLDSGGKLKSWNIGQHIREPHRCTHAYGYKWAYKTA